MSKLVLVVDDDDQAIRRYRAVLEEHGIVVRSANTLELAEAQYEKHSQDLDAIIIDGCVPGNALNSIPFIKLVLERSFSGALVAASGSRLYRREMVAAGCSYEADKYSVASLVATLLT